MRSGACVSLLVNMPVTINVTQTLCRSVSCALVGSELSCKMSQVKVSTLSLYNCFSSFRLKFSTVKSNRLYLFFCRERERKNFLKVICSIVITVAFAFTCFGHGEEKICHYLPHAQQQNIKNAMQLV